MDKFIKTQVMKKLEWIHLQQTPINQKDLGPILEMIESDVCSLYRMWKSVKTTCKNLREINGKSMAERKNYHDAMLGLSTKAELESLDQYIKLNTMSIMLASKNEPIYYSNYMQRIILLLNTNHYNSAESCWNYLPVNESEHNYELYRHYLGLLIAIRLRDMAKIMKAQRAYVEYIKHFRLNNNEYSLCYCETCHNNSIYDRLFENYPDFNISDILHEAGRAINEINEYNKFHDNYREEPLSSDNCTTNNDLITSLSETGNGSGTGGSDASVSASSGNEFEIEINSDDRCETVSLNNEKLNFAFNNIAITVMPFGRGMKATGNFAKQDCILQEKSYCEMLPAVSLNQRCNRCRDSIVFEFIVPCDNCSEVVYCSDDCRLADWNNYSHETECGLINYFQSRSEFFTLRHLGLHTPQGILDRLEQTADLPEYGIQQFMEDEQIRSAPNSYEVTNYNSITSFWRAFNSLTAPFDITRDYTNNIYSAIEATLFSLESIDEELFLSLPSAQLYRLISYSFDTILRFIVNNFSTDFGGTSICLVGSMFNHNCDSNAYWKFENGVLIVRALKDIKEGEQITVDYGTSREMTFEKRWNKIRNYYFQCDCEQCWSDYNTVPCVRCHDCNGPVPIPISAFQAVQRHGNVTDRKFYCLKCHKLEPKAIHDMKLVKNLWYDLKNASETLPLVDNEEQKDNLFKILRKILSEAYTVVHPFCHLWLNFVYYLANAYYTVDDIKETLFLGGNHTDYILGNRSNNNNIKQLLVLQNYNFEPEDAEEDMISPKLKTNLLPLEYMLNVQHLLFWTQVYFENIDSLSKKQLDEMKRFYNRRLLLINQCLASLPQLINDHSEDKQLFTVKAGEKEQTFFENLKLNTQREIELIKKDYD